jgi:hypothetical protein
MMMRRGRMSGREVTFAADVTRRWSCVYCPCATAVAMRCQGSGDMAVSDDDIAPNMYSTVHVIARGSTRRPTAAAVAKQLLPQQRSWRCCCFCSFRTTTVAVATAIVANGLEDPQLLDWSFAEVMYSTDYTPASHVTGRDRQSEIA